MHAFAQSFLSGVEQQATVGTAWQVFGTTTEKQRCRGSSWKADGTQRSRPRQGLFRLPHSPVCSLRYSVRGLFMLVFSSVITHERSSFHDPAPKSCASAVGCCKLSAVHSKPSTSRPFYCQDPGLNDKDLETRPSQAINRLGSPMSRREAATFQLSTGQIQPVH